MPLYGAAQAGYNRTSNQGLNLSAPGPGESATLFTGTEVSPPVAGTTTSVAIARGTQGSGDNGITFKASGGAASTVVDIQSANSDVEAAYGTVGQIAGDGSDGGYSDNGRAAFYRAKISAYSTGSLPVVMAQR